jgi:cytochrome c oxidase cbb3-type subunit 3
MKISINLKLIALFVVCPLLAFCQDQSEIASPSAFSNPLFLVLLSVVLLLLIVIVSFSSAFKSLADSDVLIKKTKENNTGSVKSVLIIFSLLFANELLAQSNSNSNGVAGLDAMTFYFMIGVITIELIVLIALIAQFNFVLKQQKAVPEKAVKLSETKIILSLTDAVPVEEEGRILLDHDYDGIRELDNNLPPWWKYGFYATIVFAFIYLSIYHVMGIGELQDMEFETEMKVAKLKVEEYMKKSANNVDENSVKLLTDAADLAAGKDVYISNCLVCHGKAGEGTVGPNLADNYWLHGGSVVDVFKTIKYGWVEKGMKSWKEDLSPMQISQVTSFIKSLAGTNPPNGKAPQGDLYQDSSTTLSSDSLASNVGDTIKIKLSTDTIKH